MPSSKLTHLTRWGCAALALSLVPGCSANRTAAPTTEAVPSTGMLGPATVNQPAPSTPAQSQTAVSESPAPMEAAPEPEMARSDRAIYKAGDAKKVPESRQAPMAMKVPGPEKRKDSGRAAKAELDDEREEQFIPSASVAAKPGTHAGGAVAPAGPPPPPPAPTSPPADKMAEKERPEPSTPQGNTFAEEKPNAFVETAKDRFSTFAVDVDTASYAVSRRYLNQGALPPHGAVRVEEFVNYFKYRYTPPEQGAFSVSLEGAPSPFSASHQFVRVGVQGKTVSRSQRKPAHLVFLVDTSGSMSQQDKLPLAKEAMKLAVKNLNENDTVALVTYAGSTRDVLGPTPATDLERIYKAIDGLESGGGTAMSSGMEMAYKHAVQKAGANVVSRVVVLTDGDANIGNSSPDGILKSIQGFVKEGVTLSTIGFGMGNYRDDMMEKLADKGNGNCFYIDSYKEAKKVFEEKLTGTLEVIAKDVKVQVEFDPKVVTRYRLVGYENRDIADKDFRDDKVDAGEIGAGHSVTAVYEVELTGTQAPLGTVRIRAKAPNGTEAAEQAFPFEHAMLRPTLDAASNDFRFALAVAATADVLRGSSSAQGWNLATVQKLADGAIDGFEDRREFSKLLTRARGLLSNPVAGH